MADKYQLLPNESVILKEACVAHGGVMANYTDELILTNLNIICVNKGIFFGTKNVFYYPLDQIKKYNGKPQVIMGKLSNGVPALEVYFLNGCESFNFQSKNKKTITRWIEAINQVLAGEDADILIPVEDDSDTLAGAIKEAGDQFREVFGLSSKSKSSKDESKIKASKKCIACSAPLVGYRGQVVQCKYCDTEQTL